MARRTPVVMSILTTMGLVVAGLSGCAADDNQSDRQAQVRELGAEVMPFDLDSTTHSFVTTDDGGVQTVVALDPEDTDQVALVRAHLAEIRDEFANGRFDDPITIHGSDMPGVSQLAAGADRMQIIYRDVIGGGVIVYRTSDDALVAALHDWFDAQVSDHGSDAVSESVHNTMTEEMWRRHHPGQPYPGATDDGN